MLKVFDLSVLSEAVPLLFSLVLHLFTVFSLSSPLYFFNLSPSPSCSLWPGSPAQGAPLYSPNPEATQL